MVFKTDDGVVGDNSDETRRIWWIVAEIEVVTKNDGDGGVEWERETRTYEKERWLWEGCCWLPERDKLWDEESLEVFDDRESKVLEWMK